MPDEFVKMRLDGGVEESLLSICREPLVAVGPVGDCGQPFDSTWNRN